MEIKMLNLKVKNKIMCREMQTRSRVEEVVEFLE